MEKKYLSLSDKARKTVYSVAQRPQREKDGAGTYQYLQRRRVVLRRALDEEPRANDQALEYVQTHIVNFALSVQKTAYVRGLALAAHFSKDEMQDRSLRIGVALAIMFYLEQKQTQGKAKWPGSADEPDNNINKKLNLLPELELEESIKVFFSLLQRLAQKGVGVDFVDLTEMLVNWGEGRNELALETRRKILEDYYGAYFEDAEFAQKFPQILVKKEAKK